MSDLQDFAPRPTVGIREIPAALFSPRKLFSRVEDVAQYRGSLVVLLTLVGLIGYAVVQTGLIDREVDGRVSARIALLEAQKRDVVERSALRELYAQERKKGQFERVVERVRVVAAEPINSFVSILTIAAVLFGAVALTGRKPEWNTLLTICVYAGFVEALRLLLRLVLMLNNGSLSVETSLAPLAALLVPYTPGASGPTLVAGASGLLSAVDPFHLWYWFVIAVGLRATSQLAGRRAWIVCTLCWLSGAAGRAAIAAGVAAAQAQQAASG